MGIGHFLFGFSGRINRAKMWLFFLFYFVCVIVAMIVVLGAIGFDHLTAVGQHKESVAVLFANPALKPIFSILGLFYLLFIWMDLAVKAKRLHDRNKSAWWLLVFVGLPLALGILRIGSMLAAVHAHGAGGPAMDPGGTLLGGIAFLIQLWAFVELYCLAGTAGDNRFGPDPLA